MINRATDIPNQQSPSQEPPYATEEAHHGHGGPKRRPWYLYTLAAVAVVLVVLAVAEIGPPTSSARTAAQIVSAEEGVVQSAETGSGNVEAGTDLNVNFQTSGTLANVYVHVGQHVDKGQMLATLDASSAQLTLDQAEANLTAAEDQLSSAESGASTTGGSTSSGSGSAASSSTSNSSTTSSGASIASAQAVDNTKLYAPVSGTIASLSSLSPGASVSAGSTGAASASAASGTSSTGSSSGASTAGSGSLDGSSTSSSSSTSAASSSSFAEIINTGTMTMTVAFSESDVDKLKVGQPATVTPDALSGVELGAKVSAIAPVGSSSSGVVSYNATLPLRPPRCLAAARRPEPLARPAHAAASPPGRAAVAMPPSEPSRASMATRSF
jgi:membrane fusion protein, macrolide-specific efflux system